MFERIKEAARHLFTGKDNQTLDLGRVSWAVSLLAVIGVAAWTAIHGGAVVLRDLAESLGIVSGAHGVSIGIKQGTEPDAEKPE